MTSGGLDLQVIFNAVVVIGSGLGGWILNTMWQAIKDMQKADSDLAGKVASIEVLVAGQYVTRSEYRQDIEDIKRGMQRIYDKLDGKADK